MPPRAPRLLRTSSGKASNLTANGFLKSATPCQCSSLHGLASLGGIHASCTANNGKRPLHGPRRRCCNRVVYETSRLHCSLKRRTCVRRRIHDLRHGHATQLLGRSHPKIVQERLGHSTIAVTMDSLFSCQRNDAG